MSSTALTPIISDASRDAYQIKLSTVIFGHREAESFFVELDQLLLKYGVGYPVLKHNLHLVYGMVSSQMKSAVGARREIIWIQIQQDLAEALAALLGGDEKIVEYAGPQGEDLKLKVQELAKKVGVHVDSDGN